MKQSQSYSVLLLLVIICCCSGNPPLRASSKNVAGEVDPLSKPLFKTLCKHAKDGLPLKEIRKMYPLALETAEELMGEGKVIELFGMCKPEGLENIPRPLLKKICKRIHDGEAPKQILDDFGEAIETAKELLGEEKVEALFKQCEIDESKQLIRKVCYNAAKGMSLKEMSEKYPLTLEAATESLGNGKMIQLFVQCKAKGVEIVYRPLFEQICKLKQSGLAQEKILNKFGEAIEDAKEAMGEEKIKILYKRCKAEEPVENTKIGIKGEKKNGVLSI